MNINRFNEVILTESEIIELLYSGRTSLVNVNTDDAELVARFNDSIDKNADSIDKLQLYIEPNWSVEENDSQNQTTWLMPDHYKQFNITQWLLDQCKTDKELDRVNEELQLYQQYNMIEVLICLKYLVDHMRKNNIVWGVGRGSSVASYCLYLIGIHKINSLEFNLDIKEFLKEK